MIKKWLQFIRESVQEEDDDFWSLSEDDIMEYLIDLEHENYIIEIEFGFYETILIHNGQRVPIQQTSKYINRNDVKRKDIFSDLIFQGSNIRPSYFVKFYWNRDTGNQDVTDSFEFAYNSLKDKANADISIHDERGTFNIEDIELRGGAFTKESESIELEQYVCFFIKEKEGKTITSKTVADHYDWKYDEEINDVVYLHIDVEDMADELISKRCSYKKILTDGIDYDNYFSFDYQPDIDSLFQYSLNKENSELLVKSLIKEIGGPTSTLELINNSTLNNKSNNIHHTEGLRNEIVNFLLNERFRKNLIILCKDSEIVGEIKQLCGDWNMSAHVAANESDIWSEFIVIIDKEIESYKIIKKDDKTFFSIPLNIEWYREMDQSTRENIDSLRDVFKEWSSEMSFNYDLDPKWSDYGSVDKKSMNEDISIILNKYLSR